ncbi:MAG: DivIVA domain-containing protein [Bacillota bacterium]|nr:DivIVA domain-containing protein [Bacillota bacterium]
MSLTPLDIQNKEFRRRFRGYHEQEVDEFLDEVVRDFELLVKENASLKDRLARSEERLGQYLNVEESLKRALVTAEQAAADLRAVAQKEAEIIVREAKEQAARMIASAERELDESHRLLGGVRQDQRVFLARVKGELRAQLEALDAAGAVLETPERDEEAK